MSTLVDQEVPNAVDGVGVGNPANHVGQELTPYEETDAEIRSKLDRLIAEIEMEDTNSIIFFGTKAQQQLTAISDQMLDGIHNKETGPAGNALNEMVTTLRGFDVDELDPNRTQGFLARLIGKTKPVFKFIQAYEDVRDQIERISGQMERHKTKLLTDIASLDRLYDATLDYFRDLEAYISAGEEQLRRLDSEKIPALEQEVTESEQVIQAQRLRDLRAARDDLERRVHDLKLTRQVTMQGLPSIRLVQENDKGLVNKIISPVSNPLPLWRQQLAQAVTIHRSQEAADTIRSASDLTNDLLMANAENLKQGNVDARKEIERGVFDIEAVKQANAALIDTIEDSLRIAEEGRKQRAEATNQLEKLETELRETLVSASARANAGNVTTTD